MPNRVVSLSVFGTNPQRISVIVIDTDKPAIISRQPIRASAFGNYLEDSILAAKRYAATKQLEFDPEWVLLNYCYLTPAEVGVVAKRIDQRLFDESYTAAEQSERAGFESSHGESVLST